MPLNMQVYLCTNHNVLDVKDRLLKAGKYYFLVDELTKENNVKGSVVRSNRQKIPYEFRYFSFMLMMVKAQSTLARRANIKDPRMPKFPSPVPCKKKKIHECPICLLKIKAKVSEKKLACGHVFHKVCITKWGDYNKSCPLCRDKFSTQQLHS
jgi:hypothetical protein